MCIFYNMQYVYAYIAYVYRENTYRRGHILEMDSGKREVMEWVERLMEIICIQYSQFKHLKLKSTK